MSSPVDGPRMRGDFSVVDAIAPLISACAIGLMVSPPAHAWTLKTLYSLPTSSEPMSPVTLDASGNLYGATSLGGGGYGTIFELTRDPNSGRYRLKLLYRFCSKPDCSDGLFPESPLIRDAGGNLYGTTWGGGVSQEAGTAFELTYDAPKAKWHARTLYRFCSEVNCTDGANPVTTFAYQDQQNGALYDGKTPLFGTAQFGGQHSAGVAFELLRSDKGRWREKPLYDFCSEENCSDGTNPSELMIDSAGNLFGTVRGGGGFGDGAVFQLLPRVHKFKEASIYNFCGQDACADGNDPLAGLAADSLGDLYGTTRYGGAHDNGMMFRLHFDGQQWQEQVLHDFCAEANCTDGGPPWNRFLIDAGRHLFGTSIQGGAYGKGAVFEWDGASYRVIYDFCTKAQCADGDTPYAALIDGGAGKLLGTTMYGGKNNGGTVFELSP